MGTVLLAWELGGGLGHLMQLAPLARGLAARGHRVYAALRHLGRAREVLGDAVAALLPAPSGAAPPVRQVRPPRTFAQLLHNVGWHDAGELRGLCEGWRGLYGLVRPDVVVFDFAPSAMLAARGLDFGRVAIGSGFCVPPDEPGGPPRNLRPWETGKAAEPERLAAFEARMVARVNAVLGGLQPAAGGASAAPVERVTQLFAEVDETFLLTVAELDQYAGRAGATYWGPVVGGTGGVAPQWPGGEGPRVFAYVKLFGGLGDLMAALKARGWPTVVYLDGAVDAVRAYEGETMRVERRRLEMARVARECDLAVLHGGQGATAAVLLAGKPVVLVPLVLEQRLTAAAVERLGAGVVVSPSSPRDVMAGRLDAVGTEPGYAAAAGRLAEKYAALDPAAQVGRMVERVEAIMARGTRTKRERGSVFAG